MSELTLFLIRLAYLAILWIFVLSAISVVRSDMFGARVAEPRGDGAASRPQGGQGAKSRGAASPTHVLVVEGDNPGTRASRRRPPPDRPRQRRGDPARRRLRLHPPCADRGLRGPLVRGGPRLDQRHLRRPAPHHPAHHHQPRRPGPRRQDDPGAEEVSLLPPLLRALRRGPGAQGQPGHRVRRPLAARPSATAWAARHAATSPQHRRPALRKLDHARRDARHPRPARRRRAPRGRPDRGAGRGGPRPERHLHHGDRRALRRHPLRVGHIGDSRAYLYRGGELRQLTHDHTFVQSLIDEGRITEEESRTHPHRNLILKALDGVARAEPDLFSPRRGRRPDPPLQRRRLRHRSTDDRMAAILAHGTPDFAAVELVRASLEAGSTDNVTCIVADVSEETPTDDRLEPLLVGAAADLPRRLPLRRAVGSLFRGHRSGDTGEIPPVPADIPEGAFARRPDRPRVRALRPAAAAPLHLAPALDGRAVLLGLAWIVLAAGWSWSQQQFYVADHDGKVTIFRGLNADLPGLALSHAYALHRRRRCDRLSDIDAEQVREGIEADDLDDARPTVDNYAARQASTQSDGRCGDESDREPHGLRAPASPGCGAVPARPGPRGRDRRLRRGRPRGGGRRPRRPRRLRRLADRPDRRGPRHRPPGRAVRRPGPAAARRRAQRARPRGDPPPRPDLRRARPGQPRPSPASS